VALTPMRRVAGRKGPVLYRLSGPGSSLAKGVLTLGVADRAALLEGNVLLAVYVAGEPGVLEAPIIVSGQR
jgi:hypothetical protein